MGVGAPNDHRFKKPKIPIGCGRKSRLRLHRAKPGRARAHACTKKHPPTARKIPSRKKAVSSPKGDELIFLLFLFFFSYLHYLIHFRTGVGGFDRRKPYIFLFRACVFWWLGTGSSAGKQQCFLVSFFCFFSFIYILNTWYMLFLLGFGLQNHFWLILCCNVERYLRTCAFFSKKRRLPPPFFCMNTFSYMCVNNFYRKKRAWNPFSYLFPTCKHVGTFFAVCWLQLSTLFSSFVLKFSRIYICTYVSFIFICCLPDFFADFTYPPPPLTLVCRTLLLVLCLLRLPAGTSIYRYSIHMYTNTCTCFFLV